jgi:hypothetical protein
MAVAGPTVVAHDGWIQRLQEPEGGSQRQCYRRGQRRLVFLVSRRSWTRYTSRLIPNPDIFHTHFKVATTHERPMDLLHCLY